MKKKYILFGIMLIIGIFFINCKTVYGADLDEIISYIVTVDPRTNDGTLDITYEITWKVLDSTSQGPLEWVKIGTANSKFNSLKAISSNIKKIKKYNGSYVAVYFDREYQAGEQITFKYSLHQKNMYTLSNAMCNYKFTPGWFTDCKIDTMIIRWNASDVKSSNAKGSQDNYLIWRQNNVAKGGKMTAEVSYYQSAFAKLKKSGQQKGNNSWALSTSILFGVAIFILMIGYIGIGWYDPYYYHTGFGYGYYPPPYYHHHHHHYGGFGGHIGGGGFRWRRRRLCP